MMIKAEIYQDGFSDIKVTDIVDFRDIHVIPIVKELQKYFNDYINDIDIKDDSLYIPVKSSPKFLSDNILEQLEDNFIINLDEKLSSNSVINVISVKYSEDYEYAEFNEYNLIKDTFKSAEEYKTVEQCLSSDLECNYVTWYSFTIYIEISI